MEDKSRRRQRGVTLIEILVAVLVLSIGMLGLAGLHVAGIRSNHSAYLRSQATLLSNAILDRMRVNAEAARSAAYNVEDIGSADDESPEDDIAKADLAAWRTELAVLPASSGSINCDAAGVCQVVVQWDDSRAERDDARKADARTQQFAVSTRL